MTDCSPRTNPPEVLAKYPDGSAPQVRFDLISALCSIGSTPLIMTGAIRQILLQHFCDPTNLISPTLRAYLQREGLWDSPDGNNDSTGLAVIPITQFDLGLLGVRPVLVVKDNDWQCERVGIGNLLSTSDITGRKEYAGNWRGSHTVFVISKQAAETQQLGVEVSRLLLYYGNQIMNDLPHLLRFQLLGTGAVAALKESKEHYVVPVSVGYIAEELWFTQPHAPRLKKITFRASELLNTVFT